MSGRAQRIAISLVAESVRVNPPDAAIAVAEAVGETVAVESAGRETLGEVYRVFTVRGVS